jgi:RNA polymerase sigma-70 factor, ECF subfamily
LTVPAPESDFSSRQGRGIPAGRPGAPALSPAQVLSLHARLVARDEHALAELIEVIAPWLLGMAQALLSDPDEAEEVVQEAFTIIWNRIGQVPDEPRGLLAWTLRTARNRAIDRLRSRKRRDRKFAHVAANGMNGEPVAAVEPNEAGTPGWHVHQTVHAALEALPREQRFVVWLAYFQGLTQNEIAERLGIPIGTVKTRLRLAFDKLRLVLASLKDWIV